MKMRKNLRKEMKQSRDIKERQHLKDRIRIIKENKVDRNKESRGKKVNKIAEQIWSNITNDKNLGSIEWKIKKMQIKQIKNEEGKTL